MNNPKKKCIAAIVMAFLSLNAHSNSIENFEKKHNQGSISDKGSDKKENKNKVIIKSPSGEAIEYIVSEEELKILKAKQNAMKGYIYEEEQLKDLREYLYQNKKDEIFSKEKEKKMPFSAEQILELRHSETTNEKLLNKPLKDVTFNIKTQDIDVEASKPIKVYVSKGYISSVQFYDETGAPWPLEGEIIGNENAYKKHKLGDRNNVAAFEIVKDFVESNALVSLQGLDPTIVIKLIGSDEQFDSRLSVRIPKLGPHAEILTQPPVAYHELDQQLTNVLNGDIPKNSKVYDLVGVDGKAYLKDNYLYVRSPHKLIIPPPINATKTSTGMTAYKIDPSEDFLFTVNGEMKEATIEEIHEVKIKQKNSLFK